jgi:hypothetical protein
MTIHTLAITLMPSSVWSLKASSVWSKQAAAHTATTNKRVTAADALLLGLVCCVKEVLLASFSLTASFTTSFTQKNAQPHLAQRQRQR